MVIVLKTARVAISNADGTALMEIDINVDSVEHFMESVRMLGGKAEVISVQDEVREYA